VHSPAQVETFGKTGVEMEALTAVQIGLLTIYDMCKPVDRAMVMQLPTRIHASSGDHFMTMKRVFRLVIVALFIALAMSKGIAQVTSTPAKRLPSWAPDSSCMEEFERTTEHSTRCRKQLEFAKKRMDEETKKCTDAMVKANGVCGRLANEACYKKQRTTLEAACGGKEAITTVR
jgi:hypothetical protein